DAAHDEAPGLDREHARADVDRPGARERHVVGAEVEIAARAGDRDRAVERARRGAAAGGGQVAELAGGRSTAHGAGAPNAEQERGGREEDREASHQRHPEPGTHPSTAPAPRSSMPPRFSRASFFAATRPAPAARTPPPRFAVATEPVIRPCVTRALT